MNQKNLSIKYRMNERMGGGGESLSQLDLSGFIAFLLFRWNMNPVSVRIRVGNTIEWIWKHFMNLGLKKTWNIIRFFEDL